MGLMDAFNAEDRITLKVSDYAKVLKEGVKADLMMNAVNCEVPYQYIREMVTGKKEEAPEVRVDVAVPARMFTDIFKDLMGADPADEEATEDPEEKEES